MHKGSVWCKFAVSMHLWRSSIGVMQTTSSWPRYQKTKNNKRHSCPSKMMQMQIDQTNDCGHSKVAIASTQTILPFRIIRSVNPRQHCDEVPKIITWFQRQEIPEKNQKYLCSPRGMRGIRILITQKNPELQPSTTAHRQCRQSHLFRKKQFRHTHGKAVTYIVSFVEEGRLHCCVYKPARNSR